MTVITSIVQVLLIAALFLTAWRIWRGPHVADRVVAVDLFAALVMGFLALIAFRTGQAVYLEIAAVIALVAFLATVAIGRFVEEGFLQQEDIEP